MLLEAAATRPWLVLGLGKTGQSVVDYLIAHNKQVYAWADSADLEKLTAQFPNVNFVVGSFPDSWSDMLHAFNAAVVSPGLPPQHKVVQHVARKIKLLSDIDLFLDAAAGKVLAVTGTNAKSTVVTLLQEIANCAGVKAVCGGNLGTPALDLLAAEADYYILECSSFQLQYTQNWRADTAVFLNFSSDHLNHHTSLEEYFQAKQKIYNNCNIAVVNAACPQLYNNVAEREIYFNTQTAQADSCTWLASANDKILAYAKQQIIKLSQCPKWAHNYPENIAAAAAIALAQSWPAEAVRSAILNYTPLPHRLDNFLTANSIAWFDDSKATNVGAAVAAVQSVEKLITGKVVWLCGGMSKGVDLSELATATPAVRQVICYGADAALLANVFAGKVSCVEVDDLQAAALAAVAVAEANDAVLLAPACASFDQFKDYAARGEHFQSIVRKVHAHA